MYLRFGLSCLILLVCLSCTALARSNGPRPSIQRHHRRRAASLSEFLTPPARPSIQRNRPPQFPPSSPVRHGKILSPLPSPTPQPPGFFSRLMGWMNPFGGPSQPPQPNPQVNHPGFQSPARPHDTYGPPHSVTFETQPSQQQPKVSSPQTTNLQLPSINEKSCNPCNSFPWIPMIQGIDVGNRYAEKSPGINLGESQHQNLESLNDFHLPSPSHEVKIPDFGWKQPSQNPSKISEHHNPYDADYPSPITGPIPNPHLYPGAMPPLFKAIAWDPAPAASGHIDQYRNSPSGSGLDAQFHNRELQSSPQQEHYSDNTGTPSLSSSLQSSSDYVDVLPPGAETVSGPEEYPSVLPTEVNHNPTSPSAPSFQQPVDHVAAASLNPIADTLQYQQNPRPDDKVIGNPSNVNQVHHNTRLSSDGQHVIHVEQSPIIDLSVDDNESKDSSISGVATEVPTIFQNADGTYGINATWPTHLSETTSPSNQEPSEPSSTIQAVKGNLNHFTPTQIPSTNQQEPNRNITSLLVDVLSNSGSVSRFGQRITTQRPYGTYQDVDAIDKREKYQTTSTTEEPFLEAVIKSYNNFLKETGDEDDTQVRFDARDIQPGAGFSASPATGRRMKDEGNEQPQNGKRSKKVQIIIPYTSQYTPSPFHPASGTPANPGKLQPRKVPIASIGDNSRETTEATEDELSHILQTLESLPKRKTSGKPFATAKTNTSIDPLRLQKNIDNWTIQEYSRGTTVSTAVPNSFHHQLLQSKKIPDEYFTTTEPVTSAGTIKEAEKSFGNVLAGFNYNDLDHDTSASSRIEIPHAREKSESSSQAPATETPSSSEDLSWEQVPVSISPLSKERVYIVTPQPVSKPSKFHVNSTNDKLKSPVNSTSKFESIERAYQVLPEAVNNLAVASTGPATVPLWGIMEHEEYALVTNTTTTSPETPILYSGHSRVSHTGQ